MKTFIIFNNQIKISFTEELINRYENICGTLNDKYLEHLVYVSGLTCEDTLDDIQKELNEALEEEIEVHLKVPGVIEEMVKKGLIE